MKGFIKSIVCTALSAAMLIAAVPFSGAFSAAEEEADSSVKLVINDNLIGGDQQPVIINNLTYLPLRIMFNSIQAKFTWDGENKSITATKGNNTLKMWVNKQEYLLNGKEKTMASVPVILDGSTYVPVRLVTESFGIGINWDAKTRTVKITDKSITQLSADIPVITSETTTVTETTTETTTLDPNMSSIPGVSKKVFNKMISEVNQSANSYSLGSLDKNERFKDFTKKKMFESWEKLATTDEETKFIRAIEGYYNSMITAYKAVESTYNQGDTVSACRSLARDYLTEIRKAISTFGNITSMQDITTKQSELSASYKDMSSDVRKLRSYEGK
jgi:hypothetical protein